MKIKRFFASDMRTALTQVKEELGPDAVIMSNKKVSGGVEIVAAYEEDASASTEGVNDDGVTISSKAMAASRKSSDNLTSYGPMNQGGMGGSPAKPMGSSSRAEKNNAQLADTLSELLARQKNSKNQQVPVGGMSQDAFSRSSGPKTLAEQESMVADRSRDRMSSMNTSAQSVSKMNSSDPAFAELQKEVAGIRKLLQSQLAGLMTDTQERNEPVRAMIMKLLVRGGFEESYAQMLAGEMQCGGTLRQAWKELESVLLRNIEIGNDEILRQGGAVTLVGPTGVGKTTTIAKLAAHFSMQYGADQVALITTDNYRIGAYEQLQTYGRIMGCTVKSLQNMSDMQNVLYQLRNKRLVLIDTAGMGQRDDRLAMQLDELINSCNVHIHNYLVLPATAQRRVLQDAYNQFSRIELSGAIITKLDESLSIGDAVGVCMHNHLPISYVTNGQRVPEDLAIANSRQIVQTLLMEMEDDASNV